MTSKAASGVLTPEQEQVKLFEEANNVVNAQGFYMKRCLVRPMRERRLREDETCQSRHGIKRRKREKAKKQKQFFFFSATDTHFRTITN
jgi:hypothetical protein